MSQNKWIIFGGSGGLGAAFARKIVACEKDSKILIVSRCRVNEIEDLQALQQVQFIRKDFSKALDQEDSLKILTEFNPTHVGYFPGGGPYGLFHLQAWSSHEWGWEVTFRFPARIIHYLLSKREEYFFDLQHLFFIGSNVAETQADPKAASYSASKHALKGLIDSLLAEQSEAERGHLKISLFSPDYMDTKLLPPGAHIRDRDDLKLSQPSELAKIYYDLISR